MNEKEKRSRIVSGAHTPRVVVRCKKKKPDPSVRSGFELALGNNAGVTASRKPRNTEGTMRSLISGAGGDSLGCLLADD